MIYRLAEAEPTILITLCLLVFRATAARATALEMNF